MTKKTEFRSSFGQIDLEFVWVLFYFPNNHRVTSIKMMKFKLFYIVFQVFIGFRDNFEYLTSSFQHHELSSRSNQSHISNSPWSLQQAQPKPCARRWFKSARKIVHHGAISSSKALKEISRSSNRVSKAWKGWFGEMEQHVSSFCCMARRRGSRQERESNDSMMHVETCYHCKSSKWRRILKGMLLNLVSKTIVICVMH